YRVTAADYDNNVSKPSKAVKIAGGPVSGAQAPPALTDQVRDRLAYADNVRKIHAAGKGKVRHDVFLFAGDSITAADAYTFTLGRWLARGITVRRGVGQMRTDFGKNNIDKYLEESKPEFAVVMYGTNDSKSPQAVEAAMANLSAVIDSCEKFGTVPILATIPPRGFDKDKQDGQAQFNAALVKLCRDRKTPISYCYEEMMTHDLRKMLGDGVHLTPTDGNNAAGAALLKTMEQVYFALRDVAAK
ncbi:MAG TPA: SGNH/GDSL hydrolase family protein, partial [Phycisphaerae bacterium]|nr:SGNH/GDSL hydrolase family protein [Phycisphaerae bacterium]